MTNPAASIEGFALPDLVTASEDYARRFAGATGAFLLRVQDQSITHLLELDDTLAGKSVLDHGGGHGQLADLFHALEMPRTVSASAAEIVARCGSDNLVIGPMDGLAQADQSFDYVVSVRLLAHVTSVEKTVAEMCRLAGKTVIVDYPAPRGANAFAGWFFRLKQRIEGDTRPYANVTDAELRAIFARHGFAHRETVRQFVIPMGIHRFLRSGTLLHGFERLARRIGLTRLLGNPSVARFDRITTE